MEVVAGLGTAMAAVDRSVDALIAEIDGRELATGSISATLEFAVWAERVRNRWSRVDHGVVIDLETKDAASERLAHSTAHLLASTLRISRPEAKGRVEAARVLATHDRITGGQQPPACPALAAAQTAGTVSTLQVAVVTRCLDDVERLVGLGDVTPGDVAGVEQTLTGQAQLFDPIELSRCAARILECLNPDGEPDREEAHRRLRRVRLHRVPGGMWRLTGDLLPEAGVALAAVLRPLAKPRLDNPL